MTAELLPLPSHLSLLSRLSWAAPVLPSFLWLAGIQTVLMLLNQVLYPPH